MGGHSWGLRWLYYLRVPSNGKCQTENFFRNPQIPRVNQQTQGLRTWAWITLDCRINSKQQGPRHLTFANFQAHLLALLQGSSTSSWIYPPAITTVWGVRKEVGETETGELSLMVYILTPLLISFVTSSKLIPFCLSFLTYDMGIIIGYTWKDHCED